MNPWNRMEIAGLRIDNEARRVAEANLPVGRRMKTLVVWMVLLAALADCFCPMTWADTATLSETYSEKYSCRWDCEFEIPDLPFIDEDDWREEFCDKICGDRLRGATSVKLVLTLPTLRFVDLRTVGGCVLTVGALDFPLEGLSKSSSNSLTFPQYRHEENDLGQTIQHKAGSVVISKKGDVVTVSASWTTGGESMVAGQFTHGTGTLDGAINIGSMPLRFEVDGLSVERVVGFKALTKLVTKTVKVETGYYDEEDEPVMTEESRTFSTVKVSGVAGWANPILTVTTPVPAQRWSNQVITASGTVMSFADDVTVLLRLSEEEDWTEIQTTNGLWEAVLELNPGTNRIFACAMDDTGGFSPAVVVRFVHVRTSALAIEIVPSPAAGSLIGAVDGQMLEEGVSYLLTPVPVPGYLFEKWVLRDSNGSVTEITGIIAPRLTFAHETNLLIRAYFVTNRFLEIRSNYAGLVRPSLSTNQPVGVINQGLVTLQVSDVGALKGKYVTALKTISFTSQIHPRNGTAQIVFDAGKATEATASLSFDLTDGRWVSGSMTSSVAGWSSVLEAYPVAAKDEVARMVGTHTFAIPGVDLAYAATHPVGYGCGTLKISAKGMVTGAGWAGDGTPLSFNVPLVKQDDGVTGPRYYWPFFNSKRKGGIVLCGFIEVSATDTIEAGSPFHWVKQTSFNDGLYPVGFDDASFSTAGGMREWITSRQLVRGKGTNIMGFASGRVSLSGGNLPGLLEVPVAITPDDKMTVAGPNPYQIAAKITRTTGAFTGTFLHPQTGKKTKFAGAVLQIADSLQASNVGLGWFPGWNQTGAVTIEEAAIP